MKATLILFAVMFTFSAYAQSKLPLTFVKKIEGQDIFIPYLNPREPHVRREGDAHAEGSELVNNLLSNGQIIIYERYASASDFQLLDKNFVQPFFRLYVMHA